METVRIVIRICSPSDASGILAIYAPYIENTTYNFELEVPTVPAFQERIEKYLRQWPWLVCEINGMIAGYAYASLYRERLGYQWSCECSVYVHDDHMKKGVGRALYASLFDILKKQGYRNVYAVINLPNDTSVSFHESMGFSWKFTFENVGFKLGQWKHVGWWMLQLNEYSAEPEPPVSFRELDKEFLIPLLEGYSRKIR